ncbi:hypothetical protein Y900_021455 [Mycolicibacterium aromaticivorans JS19b1 = JCM 16368]|uniref:Uncharacterized protein n=1 Tax=Mycolicibacterium aromaticivorans JS19b1 = JCM 16368 TaxID=1440774 RepID=A0A064CRU1_9MYCO|nr:hypothetical protein Y900_021455 [Mycolicibacterium aromaticivorans JS19b1 = JCM 16368]
MTAENSAEPAAYWAADRAQAGHFREQLERELTALDGQAAKLQAQLDEHSRHNRSLDVFRIQGDLRAVTATRLSVIEMLSALTTRFPTHQSDPPRTD